MTRAARSMLGWLAIGTVVRPFDRSLRWSSRHPIRCVSHPQDAVEPSRHRGFRQTGDRHPRSDRRRGIEHRSLTKMDVAWMCKEDALLPNRSAPRRPLPSDSVLTTLRWRSPKLRKHLSLQRQSRRSMHQIQCCGFRRLRWDGPQVRPLLNSDHCGDRQDYQAGLEIHLGFAFPGNFPSVPAAIHDDSSCPPCHYRHPVFRL